MLHAGAQLTLNQIRTQYWILKGLSYNDVRQDFKLSEWFKEYILQTRSKLYVTTDLLLKIVRLKTSIHFWIIIEGLDIKIDAIYAWSDSEITLSWIKRDAATWNTYVGNRVSKIHQALPKDVWGHVVSEDNPADVASRGISAKQLCKHELYWRGPSWLRHRHDSWPSNNKDDQLAMIEKEMLKASGAYFSYGMMVSEAHAAEAFDSIADPPNKTEVFLNKKEDISWDERPPEWIIRMWKDFREI
uniref:Uncharacterized protein n=1 Tax=Phlebotomus papatasi TaxID=29031 RepID=A0A1B0D819_PHLPP